MEAQEILNSLVHKDIFLSCGYGGVMFLEIGNIVDYHFEYEQGRETTRKYGDYRLFCDENWTFSDGKKVNIDRFTSSSKETDDLFESLGVQKLEKIAVVNNFEKTIFYISGGLTFTIIRDDAIDTFSLVMIPEKKKLVVFGTGEFEYKNYEEDAWYLKKRAPRPKRTDSILVSRDFLRSQRPDVLPLSLQKATEFIQPLLHQKVHEIDIDSGTRFTLRLGAGDENRWSFRFDEVWILKKENKVVLDVRKERFRFAEKLTKLLQHKRIVEITFDKNGGQTKIVFSAGFTLEVLATNRYSRWDVYDFITGLCVGSYRDQGLVYRVSSVGHASDKYKTDDVHLDAILYELEFYRNYFAKKQERFE